MHMKLATRVSATMAFFSLILAAGFAHAELSTEELAKIAQNPIGNLISVPFQENMYLNTGPLSGTYNLLNIQPDAALAALLKDHADEDAFEIATVYAFRSQPDEAMRWLDRGLVII
jgi:hypothetical protein